MSLCVDYLELKNIADELAQFFTRNGSEFDEMSKYLVSQQESLCDQMRESEINLNAQHEVRFFFCFFFFSSLLCIFLYNEFCFVFSGNAATTT
jgi:hypothetical protein